jgi:hypothetical protein
MWAPETIVSPVERLLVTSIVVAESLMKALPLVAI